jgi:hypothetical protein
MTKNQGFVFVVIPIVLILIIGVIFLPKILEVIPKQNVVLIAQTPSATTFSSPTPIITATPLPTMTPTISPSPKPSPTAKPTPKPVSGPPGAGYSSITVATEKGNFSASVLSIDLNSARMITDTGNDGDCGTNCTVLSLQDFVNRNGGFAGVNGTYFCPSTYPDCSSKTNSYDFPVYNSRLNHWVNGGNIFWNSRAIFYTDGSGAHYMQNASGFSGGLTAGVINYPGLVSGGVVQIDDNQSGLSDKQRMVGTKVGIGMRDSKNVMIVVARGVNMQQFAYVFKSLGATGALNLDTGGSTALYYNGKYLMGPGRALPNAIIFAR